MGIPTWKNKILALRACPMLVARAAECRLWPWASPRMHAEPSKRPRLPCPERKGSDSGQGVIRQAEAVQHSGHGRAGSPEVAPEAALGEAAPEVAHRRRHRKKLLLRCCSAVIRTPWLLPCGLLPSNFLSIFALMSLARVKNAFSTLMLALALVSMNLIP